MFWLSTKYLLTSRRAWISLAACLYVFKRKSLESFAFPLLLLLNQPILFYFLFNYESLELIFILFTAIFYVISL
jgi:hypothetical protein